MVKITDLNTLETTKVITKITDLNTLNTIVPGIMDMKEYRSIVLDVEMEAYVIKKIHKISWQDSLHFAWNRIKRIVSINGTYQRDFSHYRYA